MSIPASQVRPPNGPALVFEILAGLFTLAAIIAISGTWPDNDSDPVGLAAAAAAFGTLAIPAVMCAGFAAILRRMPR